MKIQVNVFDLKTVHDNTTRLFIKSSLHKWRIIFTKVVRVSEIWGTQ